MKSFHRFLLASFLLSFLFDGCGKRDLRKEIIGQWDCTDLRWNETRATDDAKRFTMVFGEDGTCISFWTDTAGSRYMGFTNRFSLLGDRVRLEDEDLIFRARLRGNELTLIRETRASPEEHSKTNDAGKCMIFQRQ